MHGGTELFGASCLPGKPPRDPFDRIIAATARDLGATPITRDRALLEYGEQGMWQWWSVEGS